MNNGMGAMAMRVVEGRILELILHYYCFYNITSSSAEAGGKCSPSFTAEPHSEYHNGAGKAEPRHSDEAIATTQHPSIPSLYAPTRISIHHAASKRGGGNISASKRKRNLSRRQPNNRLVPIVTCNFLPTWL